MVQATLVTGNKGKLREWQRLAAGRLELTTEDIDLVEIQSLDSDEIVRHKVMQAYERLQKPVLVEDISAGLEELNGLPGPFIKFFEKQLGEAALQILTRSPNAAVLITCTVGYYDGHQIILAHGTLHGSVVSVRGTNGFGFDKVVVPDGQAKTFAEMDPDEKDAISHRHLAIDDLIAQLKRL